MRFLLLFLLIFPAVARAAKIGDYEIFDYKRVNKPDGFGYYELTVQYRGADGEVITGTKEIISDNMVDDADGTRIEKIEAQLTTKLGQLVARKAAMDSHDNSQLEALKNVQREIENKTVGVEAEGLKLAVNETKTISVKLIWLDDARTDADVSKASFKSLDESIAIVNAQGEVTGVKSGETDIRINTANGNADARIIVE